VQSKGTAVKEIQLVTVDSSNIESVYTVLVDTIAKTTKLIDIKEQSPIQGIQKKPSQQQAGEVGGEAGVSMTPSDRHNIQNAINSNS
jgi:hypothetical protein